MLNPVVVLGLIVLVEWDLIEVLGDLGVWVMIRVSLIVHIRNLIIVLLYMVERFRIIIIK
jgi:hypothetical protein